MDGDAGWDLVEREGERMKGRKGGRGGRRDEGTEPERGKEGGRE